MATLILGQSKLGKAVFANKNFKAGEVIIEFKATNEKKGCLNDYTEMTGIFKWIKIDIWDPGDFDDLFNHSYNQTPE